MAQTGSSLDGAIGESLVTGHGYLRTTRVSRTIRTASTPSQPSRHIALEASSNTPSCFALVI